MTKEQYEKLKQFDLQMNTAYRSNYVNLTTKQTQLVLETMYGHDWQKRVTGNPLACSYCKLKALKTIAGEYFKYEEEHK